MSFFESVTRLPDDPIMTLPITFSAEPRACKVNLGIGAYKDEEGRFQILSCVRQAEAALLSKQVHKEYLPLDGDPTFIKLTMQLIFGEALLEKLSGRLYAAQTVGGTSALRVGADFLLQETSRTIYISHPTWPNHRLVFSRAGMEVKEYRYYDAANRTLDFKGMCEDIGQIPSGSVVLLHGVCHNPTGIDLTMDQWKELSTLIKRRKLIPFFDLAYQGFSGTTDEDAAAVRYFASEGHEMLVANSFSKSFGLYCERVGSIAIIANNKEILPNIASQVKQLIRANYSNPPRHGAQVVSEILQTPALRSLWLEELAGMRDRMKSMRQQFISGLQAKDQKRDWSFLEGQNGFFSFSGLTPAQVGRIIEKYAIYMPTNGRINVAGLNHHNLDYVINAIHDIVNS